MQEFLIALPVLLFSVVTHEYAHGYTAMRQGDPTAALAGRLTFNPVKHIDPFLTILLPVLLWFGSNGQFIFGGAKPVPVDPRNFREYRKGDLIVSSAGIAANIVLFGVFLALSIGLGLLGQAMPFAIGGLVLLQQMALMGVWLNALLACFNLIPIPPLDGSRILYHLLPKEFAKVYQGISRYGFLILLGLMVVFRDVFFLLLTPAILLTQVALRVAEPFLLGIGPF